MGPIELIFLIIVVFFGIFGVIRGYGRELGVTTMLLLTLFVLEFISESSAGQKTFDRIVGVFAGDNPATITTARFLIYCAVLIVVTYISYEGETLSFPGKRGNLIFDLGIGLLNGYLFAGSLWYYLASANWPLIPETAPFSPFYNAAVQFLPPAIFEWKYLVGLAVVMLIARVWK